MPVTFDRNQILHNPGETVEDDLLPRNGICSVVVSMEDGTTVEVGIIGRDSFWTARGGNGSLAESSFIQLPGSGYSIKANRLREHLSEPSGEFRAWMYRGVHACLPRPLRYSCTKPRA